MKEAFYFKVGGGPGTDPKEKAGATSRTGQQEPPQRSVSRPTSCALAGPAGWLALAGGWQCAFAPCHLEAVFSKRSGGTSGDVGKAMEVQPNLVCALHHGGARRLKKQQKQDSPLMLRYWKSLRPFIRLPAPSSNTGHCRNSRAPI